jgi:hypothetical protein
MIRDYKEYIGKYQGIPVYETTKEEYIKNHCYSSEDNIIYLIDDKLIRENLIFGKLHGNSVEEYDRHMRGLFYLPNRVVEEKKPEKVAEAPKTEKSEMKIEEIISGVYNTDYFCGMSEVDAFLKSVLEN